MRVLQLLLSSFAVLHSSFAAPLNVLFIVADDLNTGFSAYGHEQVKTPHLDRLAKMGMRFDRAYCNYPVCNASRTSFLTGRYPRTTEVVGNGVDPRVKLGKECVFLPEHFRAQGWFTAAIGKVTHTPQHPHAMTLDVVNDPQHDPAHGFTGDWAALKEKPDEAQPDGITARTITRLMEQHQSGPFFLAAGFHRPHAPRVAPQKYFDMYPHDSLKLPAGATETDIPQIALPPAYEPDMTDKARLNFLQSYYASVSFLDAQVGLLLAAMDRLALWDSTILVFLSDNGYHLGEHGGFWGKMSLMDQAARVPLIIRAPGMASQPCKRAVSLVDIYPTLVELAALPAMPGLEGRSLVPLLRDPEAVWNHPARSVSVRGEKKDGMLDLGRSVHSKRHTLIEWPDGSAQLYDDRNDPTQSQNLANDAAHAEILAKLRPHLLPETRIPAHKGTGKGDADDK
jgi:iduronate 2-sulfatase